MKAQAIKHPEAIRLLKVQAWNMFKIGMLAGFTVGFSTGMIILFIATA